MEGGSLAGRRHGYIGLFSPHHSCFDCGEDNCLMESNICLILEYDGTAYHGWQRQKNSLGIQQVLEKALSEVYQEQIVVTGAGRTDSGVHALGQCCNFRAHTQVPVDRVALVLNHQLPSDIRVKSAEQVSDSFHARYSAHSKRYCYLLEQRANANAFNYRYSWPVNDELDIVAMKNGAAYLTGRHDFRNFTVSGVSATDFVRNVQELNINPLLSADSIFPWQCMNQPILIEVEANGFLYKMVRIIVSRLVAVGRGRILPADMGGYLDGSFNRRIPPAPPQGLFLKEVSY